MSNTIRMTGMASGMDTETMVKQMMKPYNMKIDKMKQDKQIVQWKQDLYRDIISDISKFKNSFLDYTKPASNMLSTKNYTGLDVSTDTTASVSVTADSSAVVGNYSIKVDALAAGAKLGGGVVTKADAGVVTTATKLSELSTPVAGGNIYIAANGGPPITIAVDPNGTIGDLISNINNNSGGKFAARYSELTKQFTIQTSQTGAAATLDVTQDSAVQLTGLGVAVNSVTGTNANITITPPGGAPVQVTDKTTNNFSIDGITYNLKNTNAAPSVITINRNVQPVVDKVKDFVTKYNEMLDNITTKIEQKSQKKYLPLTDEQRSAMKTDEIEKWEEKAKEGIIRNDDTLKRFTSELRSALYSQGTGGVSLNDQYGLSTSSDPSMRGKLILDESKLKESLEVNGDKVIDMLTRVSTSQSTYTRTLTTAQKQTRMSEQGIFQKISDIMQEYTSTYRDASGKKGMMIERAGIKGDLSDINNILYKDLETRQKSISEMEYKLTDKENALYLKFSKLETAMNKYNSQSSWLTQQMGGGA